MRLDVLLSTCLLSILLAACQEAPATGDPSHAQREAEASVRHFGELRAIIHEGRTGPSVRLADVVPGPNAFGIGALSELRGEVTVVDDVVWTAIPRDDGTADVRTGEAADEAAALFVVANVARWRQVPIDADIPNDGLDAAIEQLAAAAGVDTAQPFAVRIEGPLAGLRWHVVDGSKLSPGAGHDEIMRTSVHGEEESATGTLVGFFSTKHQGVFTHQGANTHFHVVVADRNLMGHVDGVDVRRGATLYVPEAR